MITKPKSGFDGFSDDERAAMKDHARELKAAAGRIAKAAELEAEVLAKIAEMEPGDRALAEKLHAIVRDTAPELTCKLWYGMPAYVKGGVKDGRIVFFFQAAQKFKTRYATLGFNDTAQLDDGVVWPTAYALTQLSDEGEKTVSELVRRAVG